MKLELPIGWLLAGICAIGCSSAVGDPPTLPSASIDSSDKSLTGCKGKASSAIPSDGVYVITTFGGPSESQQMSCGSHTQNGSWYYAASRQRYGCGSKIQITGGGNCVVAQTDDYGPDVCVENAAGRAIIDVSPMVSQALFGTNGMGWSDNVTVTVTQVDSSTQLGPCTSTPTEPPDDPGSGSGGSGSDPGTGMGGSGSADPGTGGTGGAQCYCDASCEEYGDCCTPGCGNTGSGGSGSSGSGGGGGQCYCDASCEEYGDCCTPCCGNSGSGGSSSGGSSGGYCGDGYCDISGGEDCGTCIEDCDAYGGCY